MFVMNAIKIDEYFSLKNKFECLSKCSSNYDCSLLTFLDNECILYYSRNSSDIFEAHSLSFYMKIRNLDDLDIVEELESSDYLDDNNFTVLEENTIYVKGIVYSMITLSNSNLLTVSKNGIISIWNSTDFKLIKSKTIKNVCKTVCEISSDRIIIGTFYGNLLLFDLKDLKILRWFTKAHSKAINSLISLDSNLFASGSSDSTIKIWKKDALELIRILNAHSHEVLVLFKYNTSHFFSGSCDKSVKIWNINNFSSFFLNGHYDCVIGLNRVKNYLVSASNDTIITWNLSTKSKVKTILLKEKIKISALVIWNGNITVGFLDGSIMVFNNFSNITINKSVSSEILTMVQVENNKLITSFANPLIKIWNYNF
ncbi:unnamed protein product [Brachionus calyciflorus]|uniref:Uncharacterized protein n=1 Tax=Brachionus calyciflorus TaxID=104777 RepID=A0A813ZIN7_9BILA|nr:unnamed protein product [Brachionus calyciflorus]